MRFLCKFLLSSHLFCCAFKTEQDYEYSGGYTTASRVVKISTLGFSAYVDR